MISEKHKAFIKDLIYISLPTCLFFLFLWIRTLVNIGFISKKYSDYKLIEALGLTDLYINCSTYIVIVGISGGVEILGSNYYGDKNYYYLGVTTNKAKLISLSYYVIITILNYFFAIKVIVFLFHIEEEIIHLIRPYLNLTMICMLLQIFINVDFRYLSIIGKAYVNTIVLFITFCLHPIINFILITKMDLSLIGCGISNVLIQFLSTFGLIMYIKLYDPLPGSNIAVNIDCFKDWGKYLKICMPTTLMLIGEWMGFELQALLVMHFSALDYTVHIIFINIQLMLFTFTLSNNISMSINVAQKIVSYSKEKLIEFIKVSYIVNKIGISIFIFMLYLFRDQILNSLTTSQEMKRIAVDSIFVLYIFLFFDNGYFFFGGVLKGFAYLVIPAIITVVNFYVIQIFFSYFFCLYLGLGVKGIWMSLAIGTSISYFLFYKIFSNLNIEKMKNEACERINFENNSINNNDTFNKKESFISNGKMVIELDDFEFNYKYKQRRSSRLYNDEF